MYAANHFNSSLSFGSPESLSERGWTPLAPAQALARQSTIKLDTGGVRYRYYLLWITSLPPGSETAAISEITLFE